MMDDEDCSLNAINAGSATADYMAYQFKYDTIHGKYGGSVETDGDTSSSMGRRSQPAGAGTPRRPTGGSWEPTTFARGTANRCVRERVAKKTVKLPANASAADPSASV